MLHEDTNAFEHTDLIRHRKNAQRRIGEDDSDEAAEKWLQAAMEKHPNFSAHDFHELITNECRRGFTRFGSSASWQ